MFPLKLPRRISRTEMRLGKRIEASTRRRAVKLRGVTTAILIAVFGILLGCGRPVATDESSEPSSVTDVSLPDLPADAYLRHVLRRYGGATHYRDEGEVCLSVEVQGKNQRFTAPMHVLLDGPTIWVAAYDGRIWSDSQRTIGWVHDEKTQHHDSQVVVGTTASPGGRAELNRLLGEPILREKIVAGLGGPPPQLEWLLEPDPMAKLFDGKQAEVRYGGIQTRQDVSHVVVEADAEGDRYRFWIDPNASLIRSVDLPVTLAQENQSTPQGWRVVALELRLPNASFSPPQKRVSLNDMRFAELPTRPRYVNAMVPLPPAQPHRMIGRWLESFQAKDVTNRWSITERGAGTEFTLFAAVPSDGRGAALLQLLPALQSQVPALLSSRFATVVFVDEQSVTQFDPAQFLVVRDPQAKIQQRIGLSPGATCLVDREGRVLWFADAPQWMEPASVVSVLVDSVSGIDVPQRIADAWKADQNAYQQKLREVGVAGP